MALDPRISFFQAEYTIVTGYLHDRRIYWWRIEDTNGFDDKARCLPSGTSDDEEECFQCACLARGQLAEADAEREREEKERLF